MNVNKKLGRFKQWAGERMGGEARTSASEDFKAMEAEMNLRNDGLTANHKSMSNYMKAISKRDAGEEKEKVLPVGAMATTMASHGEDFENDSEFGQCLIAMGRTNERVARIQESYVAKANTTWLESLERSLAQMKEYQKARKTLEGRRLAYDTAVSKMEKSRREDFRAEEEARSQKVKYEESNEDVFRRMQDIQEGESESVNDLTDFLDAQLEYYARCYEAMQQLKQQWPAVSRPALSRQSTRSDTAYSYTDEPAAAERPAIRSIRSTASSVTHSPQKELPGFDFGGRPGVPRASTFDSPSSDAGYAISSQRMMRVPSDNLSIRTQKAQLRAGGRIDTFADPPEPGYFTNGGTNSPGGAYSDRAPSPVTSVHSAASSLSGRKPPPPPPPSRAKKPPPPPPPMKRAGLSTQATY